MTDRVVIDASVALAVLLGEPDTDDAQAVVESFDRRAGLAPQHWKLEIANILRVAVGQGRATAKTAIAMGQALDGWRVEIDEETADRATGDTLTLSLTHGLTAYDAAYLELAIRTGSRLATFDRRLARAAAGLGVALSFPLVG